jgi:hypothetical protein
MGNVGAKGYAPEQKKVQRMEGWSTKLPFVLLGNSKKN